MRVSRRARFSDVKVGTELALETAMAVAGLRTMGNSPKSPLRVFLLLPLRVLPLALATADWDVPELDY